MAISDAESLVMEVLWEKNPATSDDVVAELSKTTDWQEPTIKTLLNRLLKKRAIAAERDGRATSTARCSSARITSTRRARHYPIVCPADASHHWSRISPTAAS